MGFVPFFVVISGVMFLAIALNYHTFKNYLKVIQTLVSKIQEAKKQVRADVDQLEILSVPELEGFCENMCGYLSGKIDSNDLESKLGSVNVAFDQLYSDTESKHIQEEILRSINQNVRMIARMNRELKENQFAYEKLLKEKPYSMIGKMLKFKPVQLPWEADNSLAISS
jgi:hypothetical protein